MISPESAVRLVQATERHNECALVGGAGAPRDWLNPSKSLVDHALERLVGAAPDSCEKCMALKRLMFIESVFYQ